MTYITNLAEKKEDLLTEIQVCLDKYKVGDTISEKEFLRIVHDAFTRCDADMRAIIHDLELNHLTLDCWVFGGEGAPQHFERPIVLDWIHKHLSKPAEAA